MGIDIPDIRFVVHLTIPDDLNKYYQESGRAGRDGNDSVCRLYYSDSEYRKIISHTEKDPIKIERAKQMQNYCETRNCRRRKLLESLGETWHTQNFYSTSCCDNCKTITEKMNEGYIVVKKPFIPQAQTIAKAIKHHRKISLNHLTLLLRGSKSKELAKRRLKDSPFHGNLKDVKEDIIKRLLRKLVRRGVIEEVYLSGKHHSTFLKYEPGKHINGFLNENSTVMKAFTMNLEFFERDLAPRQPRIRSESSSTSHITLKKITNGSSISPKKISENLPKRKSFKFGLEIVGTDSGSIVPGSFRDYLDKILKKKSLLCSLPIEMFRVIEKLHPSMPYEIIAMEDVDFRKIVVFGDLFVQTGRLSLGLGKMDSLDYWNYLIEHLVLMKSKKLMEKIKPGVQVIETIADYISLPKDLIKEKEAEFRYRLMSILEVERR